MDTYKSKLTTIWTLQADAPIAGVYQVLQGIRLLRIKLNTHLDSDPGNIRLYQFHGTVFATHNWPVAEEETQALAPRARRNSRLALDASDYDPIVVPLSESSEIAVIHDCEKPFEAAPVPQLHRYSDNEGSYLISILFFLCIAVLCFVSVFNSHLWKPHTEAVGRTASSNKKPAHKPTEPISPPLSTALNSTVPPRSVLTTCNTQRATGATPATASPEPDPEPEPKVKGKLETEGEKEGKMHENTNVNINAEEETKEGKMPIVQQTKESKTVGKEEEQVKTARTELSEIKIGKLTVYTNKILGYGSLGTIVFHGKFDDRIVAIKRLLHPFYDVAAKEISALIAADSHPNVIRYFAQEQDTYEIWNMHIESSCIWPWKSVLGRLINLWNCMPLPHLNADPMSNCRSSPPSSPTPKSAPHSCCASSPKPSPDSNISTATTWCTGT
jgi:hypothetical protein